MNKLWRGHRANPQEKKKFAAREVEPHASPLLRVSADCFAGAEARAVSDLASNSSGSIPRKDASGFARCETLAWLGGVMNSIEPQLLIISDTAPAAGGA